MRNFSGKAFFATVLFLVSTFSLSAWAAPRSLPIVCRGGAGSLKLTTMPNNAVFIFNKSSGSAPAGLEPGECAWLDRAVGIGEPSCIQQYNTTATAWIYPGRKQDSSFSSGAENHWLKDLLSDSNYVTFQAYNPHSGACLVVTRVGE